MRPRLRLVVALAGIATLAAACSGGGDTSADRGFERPEQAGADEPGCEHIVAAEGRRFRRPGETDLMYLIEATTVPTVCYDRISFVFELGGGADLPPGYVVEYRDPPFVEGISTTTEGFDDAKAYLYVEMQPTATVDRRFAGSGRLTYRGNQRLSFDEEPAHTVIVEWVKDYEDPTPEDVTDDKVIWIIGLDEKRPFTVDSANQPPRINILVMR